jgi:nucleotide-binding universal stress UspA family protein
LGAKLLDLQKLVTQEYESQLKKFVDPIKQEKLRVSTKILVGTPFLEIIREVIAHKRDLVMMTAEGKGGLKERLFGSTSLHLMRKCPCPVWVMKPDRRKRFMRILAAIDPDPTENSRDALNAKILQLAASLAAQDNAELHVAHAWNLFGEHILRSRGSVTEADIRKWVRFEEGKHLKMIEKLLAAQTGTTAHIHLIKGEAGRVITEVARTETVDLLVMGTVCRTGIPGFFIGNTAEKILDEVDCSVLTVKPEEFVSPVKLVEDQ